VSYAISGDTLTIDSYYHKYEFSKGSVPPITASRDSALAGTWSHVETSNRHTYTTRITINPNGSYTAESLQDSIVLGQGSAIWWTSAADGKKYFYDLSVGNFLSAGYTGTATYTVTGSLLILTSGYSQNILQKQ
jgi:hypothetical protein